jgi:hypothetical protein
VVETFFQLVRALPQPAAGAERGRVHRDVQGVDQVGVEELADRLDTTTQADVLVVGGWPRTKWKVVSDRLNDGRGWWVSTNTGVWKGGSSPHHPSQSWSGQGPRTGPNLFRPMISAPMWWLKSRVK